MVRYIYIIFFLLSRLFSMTQGNGPVAQWKSICLLSRGSRVQSPPGLLFFLDELVGD